MLMHHDPSDEMFKSALDFLYSRKKCCSNRRLSEDQCLLLRK